MRPESIIMFERLFLVRLHNQPRPKGLRAIFLANHRVDQPTGIESLLTELVIALVVRTRRPFYRSRPGALLLGSTAALAGLTIALPYIPFAGIFGFVPLPAGLLGALLAITVLYVVASEITKSWFYRRSSRRRQSSA